MTLKGFSAVAPFCLSANSSADWALFMGDITGSKHVWMVSILLQAILCH